MVPPRSSRYVTCAVASRLGITIVSGRTDAPAHRRCRGRRDGRRGCLTGRARCNRVRARAQCARSPQPPPLSPPALAAGFSHSGRTPPDQIKTCIRGSRCPTSARGGLRRPCGQAKGPARTSAPGARRTATRQSTTWCRDRRSQRAQGGPITGRYGGVKSHFDPLSGCGEGGLSEPADSSCGNAQRMSVVLSKPRGTGA
jgi:hypothetical protein